MPLNDGYTMPVNDYLAFRPAGEITEDSDIITGDTPPGAYFLPGQTIDEETLKYEGGELRVALTPLHVPRVVRFVRTYDDEDQMADDMCDLKVGSPTPLTGYTPCETGNLNCMGVHIIPDDPTIQVGTPKRPGVDSCNNTLTWAAYLVMRDRARNGIQNDPNYAACHALYPYYFGTFLNRKHPRGAASGNVDPTFYTGP